MKDKIKDSLQKRIEKLKLWEILPDIELVYIAGNCLNPEKANDYDIFPVSKKFEEPDIKAGEIIAVTTNAITLKHYNNIVQLCDYYHESIEKLVNSFDFSHIQIAIKYSLKKKLIEDIYFSDKYIESRVLNKSSFTGSEYPLSSLFRVNKYINRGTKIKASETIAILHDIIARGFEDYEDFKDQIEAVDLFILDPDEMEYQPVIDFYNQLTKGKKKQ